MSAIYDKYISLNNIKLIGYILLGYIIYKYIYIYKLKIHNYLFIVDYLYFLTSN